MFSNSAAANAQQQQKPLWGAPAQPQQPQQQQPWGAQPQQQPLQQQQQQQWQLQQQLPAHLTFEQQTEIAQRRLQQAGFQGSTREKKPWEQATTLIRKWDPNSQDTLMQSYLYNAVSAAYAPFYDRAPDEDEAAWEKALQDAPKASDGEGGEAQRYVPVLVRGFFALGKRVEYQAQVFKEMMARLHEMNNSLTAIMTTHQQRISVGLQNARRQHVALSQRTLRLAVKLQLLRSRGYALDVAEESLRKTLITLERRATDPVFAAREEEIWARMVALRERARWLEEEGKRVGRNVRDQGQSGSGGSAALPEEVLVKTKKILGDYDGQLRHLAKELEEITRELQSYEESVGRQ